mmetsp:Transcript_104228/g.207029  ORF Transcript_104228/g.207029 Transcript_104228/m.207029 type:complete len:238 (-) Transcript_104228:85-798(-)
MAERSPAFTSGSVLPSESMARQRKARFERAVFSFTMDASGTVALKFFAISLGEVRMRSCLAPKGSGSDSNAESPWKTNGFATTSKVPRATSFVTTIPRWPLPRVVASTGPSQLGIGGSEAQRCQQASSTSGFFWTIVMSMLTGTGKTTSCISGSSRSPTSGGHSGQRCISKPLSAKTPIRHRATARFEFVAGAACSVSRTWVASENRCSPTRAPARDTSAKTTCAMSTFGSGASPDH